MGLYNIFNISGSSMSAQSVRLNTVASNLANADTVSGNVKDVYRSRQPVFAAVMDELNNNQASVPVRVAGVVESQAPARQEYQPDHPMANAQGYVFKSNVNTIEEMTNMMAASRSYQNNVEVFNTAKQLLLKTLNMGR
jgi:flagellar basal-body rod protein FlgC